MIHKVLVLGMLAAVVTVSYQEIVCQVVNGTATENPKRNKCVLDDFVPGHIKTSSGVIETSSRCQRRDVAYTKNINAPPVIINKASISNDLSGSFCIAIAADTTTSSLGPIMAFVGAGGAAAGGITLSGSTISVNISGQTAQFNETATKHQSFQLCSDGSTLTLFQYCANPQTVSFGPTSLARVTMIGIYASPQNTASTFQGSITQLYFISCSGPAVVTQEMVNLQCQANPMNCSVPSSNLTEVVNTYETHLNHFSPHTTTICSSVNPTTTPSVSTHSVSAGTPVVQKMKEDCDGGEEGLFVAGVILTVLGVVLIAVSAAFLVVTIIVFIRRK